MIRPISVLLKTLLIFLISQHTASYYFTGYAIRDLEKNDANFAYEADLWNTSIPVIGLPYTVCSGTYLLGGYQVLGSFGVPSSGEYFQRIYNRLPTHSMIYFSFTIWALDAWNGALGDSFLVQFDNRYLNGWMFREISFPEINLCGVSTARDLSSVRVLGRAYHNQSTLHFRMVSQLNQWPSHQSFGIRDINLLFVDSPVTTKEGLCGRAPISLDINQCSCPEGQYLDNSTATCVACHPNCKSCFGPDSSSCYECASDTFFGGKACLKCHKFCDTCFGEEVGQCNACKPGTFMINGDPTKCIDKCDTSLFTVTYSGTTASCSSPCAPSEFRYWNGTCQTNCPIPLQQTVILTLKTCIYPCGLGQYLYWNGSCHATCTTPFQPRITAGLKYCDAVCSIANGFLYWNGTCSTACDFPLVQEIQSTNKFCNFPCDQYNFLYPNGSCLKNCDSPLLAKQENGKQYCEYPCVGSAYLDWKGVCRASCDFPFRVKYESLGKFCLTPCEDSAEYYYEETGKCESTCPFFSILDPQDLFLKCLPSEYQSEYSVLKVPEKTLLGEFLAAPSDINTVSVFALPKMLYYIRYLDIKIPLRLGKLLQAKGRSPLSLRLPPIIPSKISAAFALRPLPAIFVKREVHSSFIVNFWQELITWAVPLSCIVIFTLLEKLFEKFRWPRAEIICERFRVILGWSLLLIFIGTGVDDLLFATLIEIRTVTLDSLLAITSFLSCIFVLGIVAVFFFKAFMLLPDIYQAKIVAKTKTKPEEYAWCLVPWQNYQVTYRKLDANNRSNKIFFFIYMLRIALPMLIATWFYFVPLMQTIIYVLISLSIIVYLLKKRPLKKAVNHYQLLVLESIILMINIFLLALTILDIQKSNDQENIELLGDLVIVGTNAIGIHLIFFFALKILLELKDAFLIWKENSDIAKETLLQILFLPLQQTGMGFETAQVARFPSLSGIPSSEKPRAPRTSEPRIQTFGRSLNLQATDTWITRYFNAPEDEIELFARVGKQVEEAPATERLQLVTMDDIPKSVKVQNKEIFRQQSSQGIFDNSVYSNQSEIYSPDVLYKYDKFESASPDTIRDRSPEMVPYENDSQLKMDPVELELGSTLKSDRPFLTGMNEAEKTQISFRSREGSMTIKSQRMESVNRKKKPEADKILSENTYYSSKRRSARRIDMGVDSKHSIVRENN